MLVLTRRKGESIRIKDDIVVKVLKVKGEEIMIGIDAPENVDVQRLEKTDDDNRGNR